MKVWDFAKARHHSLASEKPCKAASCILVELVRAGSQPFVHSLNRWNCSCLLAHSRRESQCLQCLLCRRRRQLLPAAATTCWHCSELNLLCVHSTPTNCYVHLLLLCVCLITIDSNGDSIPLSGISYTGRLERQICKTNSYIAN